MLRVINFNVGVEVWYCRQLDNYIREMQKFVVYWLIVNYKVSGVVVVMDVFFVVFMCDVMKKFVK